MLTVSFNQDRNNMRILGITAQGSISVHRETGLNPVIPPQSLPYGFNLLRDTWVVYSSVGEMAGTVISGATAVPISNNEFEQTFAFPTKPLDLYDVGLLDIVGNQGDFILMISLNEGKLIGANINYSDGVKTVGDSPTNYFSGSVDNFNPNRHTLSNSIDRITGFGYV
jgi:hypothetical protein